MLAMKPLGIRQDAQYRTVSESRIVEMISLHGWANELEHGEHAAVAAAASDALQRWIALGLPSATAPEGGRLFDPAEALNFAKWDDLRHADPFYEHRLVATARRNALGFHGPDADPAEPPLPDSLPAERFSVTLMREFDLHGIQPGKRIVLRLPLPLEDDTLSDLSVDTIAPAELAVAFERGEGRLDARFHAPEARALALGIDISFTARPTLSLPPSAPLPADEIEVYTRDREGLVQLTPRIRALARRLAGSEREPSLQLRRFHDFIFDGFHCGMVHYDELDASAPTEWMLDTGWYDCQLGTALLVALCRATGIPARVISGYLMYPQSPVYHYWAEVWLDDQGWIPVDLMSYDLSARGRDARWRDYFYGRLDYRMKTQRLPRWFNLTPSVRFPPQWYMLTRRCANGVEIGTFATTSGALVYRDQISVRRGDAAFAHAARDTDRLPPANAGPL